jgi:hypothetical protein
VNEDINEFVGEMKSSVKTIFNRLDKLEKDNESLKEITTILKVQQIQYSEQHELLTSMHENLVEINSTVKEQGKQIGELGNRVGHLEDDTKIDTRKIKKEIIYKILPSSIIGLGFGLLVAYLVWQFGWK